MTYAGALYLISDEVTDNKSGGESQQLNYAKAAHASRPLQSLFTAESLSPLSDDQITA